MTESVIYVRLSLVAESFMAAAFDLLEAVEGSDAALVTDRVTDAAFRLRGVVDEAETGTL